MKITHTEQFEVIACCSCAMRFAVPHKWQAEREQDHVTFFCPNGHPQSYVGETDAEKFRRERDRLAQRIAQRDDEIAQWKATADEQARQRAEVEKRLKRVAKRTSAGTCPCCNRTFSALARHMQTKHPAFIAEQASGEGAAKH